MGKTAIEWKHAKVSLEEISKKHTISLCEEELVFIRDLKNTWAGIFFHYKTTLIEYITLRRAKPYFIYWFHLIQKEIKTIFCLFNSAIYT